MYITIMLLISDIQLMQAFLLMTYFFQQWIRRGWSMLYGI